MSILGRLLKGHFCPFEKRPQKDMNGGKMPNWTKEQKQAIFEKDSNLLVAAAARKPEKQQY